MTDRNSDSHTFDQLIIDASSNQTDNKSMDTMDQMIPDNNSSNSNNNNPDTNNSTRMANIDFLPSDHPLMKRLQDTLTNQLNIKNNLITIELHDKQVSVKQLKQQRESLGIELYNIQHQLATLQHNTTKQYNTFTQLKHDKLKLDNIIQQKMVNTNEISKQRNELESLRKNKQSELDELKLKYNQIILYTNVLNDDINTQQNMTQSNELYLRQLEKSQLLHDYEINKLTTSCNELQHGIELIDITLNKQLNELQSGQNIIEQTKILITKLNEQKKLFMIDYNNSIKQINKLNSQLNQLNQQLIQHNETIRTLRNQLDGIKHNINESNQNHTKYQQLNQRLLSEIESVQQLITQCNNDSAELQSQLAQYNKECNELQNEIDSYDMKRSELIKESSVLEKNALHITSQRNKLQYELNELKLHNIQNQQHSNDIINQIQTNQHKIDSANDEIESIDNEMARIHVDLLNMNINYNELLQMKTILTNELNITESDTNTMKLQLNQIYKDIEKRQVEMSHINSQIDEMKHKQQQHQCDVDELLSPLEVTIHQLTYQLSQCKAQVNTAQKQWIQQQITLVSLIDTVDTNTHKYQELQQQHIVLQQKNIRLESINHTIKSDITELQHNNAQYHIQLNQLNDIIYRTGKDIEDITESNSKLSQQYMSNIQQLQVTSESNIQSINKLDIERNVLIDELME